MLRAMWEKYVLEEYIPWWEPSILLSRLFLGKFSTCCCIDVRWGAGDAGPSRPAEAVG